MEAGIETFLCSRLGRTIDLAIVLRDILCIEFLCALIVAFCTVDKEGVRFDDPFFIFD